LTSISSESTISAANLPEKFFRDRTGLYQREELNKEKQALIDALEQFGKSVSGKREAAKYLGISLATSITSLSITVLNNKYRNIQYYRIFLEI
jgi:hypothetical protein